MGILAVAKDNKIDLEIVETTTPCSSSDYKKLNKLGKVPTFEGSDGYILTECIAIAIYSMSMPSPRQSRLSLDMYFQDETYAKLAVIPV